MTTLKEALDQLAQGHMLDNEQKKLIIDKWQKELGIQPCEDCVSRKDIYFRLTNGAYPNESIEQFIDRLVKELNTFPPVTPKAECSCNQIKWERDMAIAQLNELGYGLGENPRTGHWIKVPGEETFFCSKCNCRLDDEQTYLPLNFCPNCGRKMVEPQESENGNEL